MTCEKDKAIPCDAVSCAPSRPGCSGPKLWACITPPGRLFHNPNVRIFPFTYSLSDDASHFHFIPDAYNSPLKTKCLSLLSTSFKYVLHFHSLK